jgi:excisionase family DNA binding protein
MAMGAAERLPHLYTEAEAAEYLGVNELTLYRWRRRGQIACMMVGKSPRYTDQHITDYLKARECQVSSSAPTPSNAAKAPRTGNVHGGTSEGSNNALLLAQQILSRRKTP